MNEERHELRPAQPSEYVLGTWFARCTCRKVTRNYDEPWRAERAIRDHIRDKTAGAEHSEAGNSHTNFKRRYLKPGPDVRPERAP